METPGTKLRSPTSANGSKRFEKNYKNIITYNCVLSPRGDHVIKSLVLHVTMFRERTRPDVTLENHCGKSTRNITSSHHNVLRNDAPGSLVLILLSRKWCRSPREHTQSNKSRDPLFFTSKYDLFGSNPRYVSVETLMIDG